MCLGMLTEIPIETLFILVREIKFQIVEFDNLFIYLEVIWGILGSDRQIRELKWFSASVAG